MGIAQRLFHERGYDAVSVADLTEALGINPPSFYAAFGSKAALYARVLERYTGGPGAIPFRDLLRADRPVSECLAALLEEAARRYAADPVAGGCLVIEGVRCNDLEARKSAYALHVAGEELIRSYVAARWPTEAEAVTDFVITTMAGLSAQARIGHSLDRLLTTARIASRALAQLDERPG